MDRTAANNEGADGCSCRDAVTRAYGELRRREVPERAAFEAAITIYRLRHPEQSVARSRDVIAEWLDGGA